MITTKTTEHDMPSDIPKSNSSTIHGASEEDNRDFNSQQMKEPQRNNLKILIPAIAAVIGIVIAVVVIFGSRMTHQQPQPSPPSNVNLTTSTNTPPTATSQSVTINQNTPVNITLAGSDPQNPNANLTAAIVTNPSHGTLSNINQDTGVVTYTPNQDYTGNDSFTFKVNDGKVDSKNRGTISVTVNQQRQQPPTALPPATNATALPSTFPRT